MPALARLKISTVLICLFLLLGLLWLSGCGSATPPPAPTISGTADVKATSTEIVRLTMVAQYHQAETAAPLTQTSAKLTQEFIPPPTRTPDNRSQLEKCIDSPAVVYVIKNKDAGVGPTVSLTWRNDTGGTEQGDYNMPFCAPFGKFKSGDYLYISAQIASGPGRIECFIYDHGKMIATASASGFAAIATCEGSK